MGTILGGATAAILSLQAAPPGAQLAAVRAAGEAARAPGNSAPAAMPEPEAQTEVQPEVEPAPSESASQEGQPAPETPIVEVPAGSEFAKAKPDEAATVAAAEDTAADQQVPMVSEPAAEGAPELAEVSTADQPESQTEAPAAPEAPQVTEQTTASAAPEEDASAPVDAEATEPVSQPVAESAGNALPQIPEASGASDEPASEGAAESAQASQELTEEPKEEPAVAAEAEAEAEPTVPQAGLAEQLSSTGTTDGAMPGQKVTQLPTIGTQADGNAEEPLPAATEEDSEELPPLLRNAAPFDLAGVGPTVSIVLLDPGEGFDGVDEQTIRGLGFPVTIAVDPNSSEARARAADYRAAGFEIAIVARNGLQRGMTGKDIQVAVEALSASLPESIAMIPAPDALFQIDREVVKHLAIALKDDGRGLITYARGLNVAGQAAEQAGVPHASVDRVVDEYKEDADAVRRLLERAAFDAGQKGRSVIVAHAYPETLKALEAWVATGPKGVTLAPVSAGMIADLGER
ncbi:divergent polysaccharide deacetylase family protein [Defluviimonas sp. WL0002]|uniref:Divergent polysaccharide deacetylase family protein n=1 Tax=Albidovulum marisflavi TaxID=2984159 RepID=A0ABT2ZBV4_9RHOB|nr:divergent polysaccharide deacetylase family protein [Defluviimonas sp. WL0002]MCV2868584.1 divergent polysaccharide deacetylase family protein [Defluviimonas sp. WL0002]